MKSKSLVFLIAIVAMSLFALSAQAVTGGLLENSENAVVGIVFSDANGIDTDPCSGVMIEPTVVLTSGSCIKNAFDNNLITTGRVWFGTEEAMAADRVNVLGGIYHRRLNALLFSYDVGLLLLEREPVNLVVTPVTLHAGPLPADVLDKTLRIVGFGAVDHVGPDYIGGGIKRQADLPVNSLGREWVKGGDDLFNACKGDTGAPLYYDFGLMIGEEVVAIAAETAVCFTPAGTKKTRIDLVYDDFIIPAVDLWIGPCVPDGTCVTSGCRSPDPDCDPCLADGTCTEGCTVPDWDCPLGGAFDADCTDDFDCESRLCVAAPDDNRIKYCSTACMIATAATDCNTNSTCINGACVFQAPTRGALGADCSVAPCRSGLPCHPDGYCVEECTGTSATCPRDYICQASSLGVDFACSLPITSPSDFCTVSLSSGTSRGSLVIVLLFGLTMLGYAVARSRR